MNLIVFTLEICLFVLLVVAIKEVIGGIIHAEKSVMRKAKKKLNKWAQDV